MRIRWTPPAADDLQSICDYLREKHPRYSDPTMRKIYQRLIALKAAPYLGRPGVVPGTRELLFLPLPYLAIYEVEDSTIKILRILHSAQNWY